MRLAIKTFSAANSAVATRITAVKDFELAARNGSCCNVKSTCWLLGKQPFHSLIYNLSVYTNEPAYSRVYFSVLFMEGLSPSTEKLILVRYYTFSSMKTDSTSFFDLGKPPYWIGKTKFQSIKRYSRPFKTSRGLRDTGTASVTRAR